MTDLAHFKAKKVSGNHEFDTPPAELIADLYDQIMKFGVDDPRGPIRRISVTDGDPIYASVVTVEGNMNMTVSRLGGGGLWAELCVGFILSDPLPSGIIWDVRISHGDVREMIRKIDAEMRSCPEAFDSVTSGRKRCVRDTGFENRVSVDEYFTKRGAMFQVPKGFEAEEYRQLFDRPDDLVTRKGPDGDYVLYRIQDEAFIVKRAVAIRNILKVRHGITDGNMSTLTPDQRNRIMAEVNGLLKTYDN